MQILEHAVPYYERHILTSSGTAVVWPFLNAEKGPGPYELFLDTNAFSDAKWYEQLPNEIRNNCVVNPWSAVLEQWLSNPQFRSSPKDRINEMIDNLKGQGVKFRENFAQQQEAVLRKYDSALRSQFSLIMPYIVIMKSLLAPKNSFQEAEQKLLELTQLDIPRFTSAIMLTALGILLKGKQSLKLENDQEPAFSYMESFLAFQPKKKGEDNGIDVRYLRNRAGDLNLWLTLPLLMQHGYRFVGTPAIVTGDKALHRLIVRAIPPVIQKGGAASFGLSPAELPQHLYENISKIASKVEVRAILNPDEKKRRAEKLFEHAKTFCADKQQELALGQIFDEWFLPGFGKNIEF